MTRVLIVDDKDENVYLLRRVLEAGACTVDSAQDGLEALAKARAARPDLVVSDLLMPRMDGYALLREWKSDPELSRTPFVVYTATYLEDEDEQLALNLGADAFLSKPMEPEEFLARIREVVAAKHSAPPKLGPGEQPDLLRRHADTLIRKLDEKTLELEAANAQLRAELARREKVEASLRESETLLRLAGQMARLGGWSLELGDGHLTWSDQVCANHRVPPGYSPSIEEAINQYAPEFRDVIRARVDACARDGTPFDDEMEVITSAGRRWLRMIGHPERDASGKIVRIRGTCQDVHARRELENQYRQAQKMEVVGRLAGGVAHDFGNLLTVINGYSDLLLETLGPGESRERVEIIRRAGDQSANLSRQLLAFSRREAPKPRVISLNDTVKGLERMLRRLIGEDVKLRSRLAPDLGAACLDVGQLEQVLLNLAVNARDAMPSGGSLVIETRNVEVEAGSGAGPAGRYATLSVTDTGTGMTPETRARIFEPFFTTKPLGIGTGLGLAVVQGIVQQHGGHIDVLSEPGAGTTFTLYWPRADEPVPSARQAAAPAPAPRGHETLLLVEDDDLVRAFTRSVLARCGYTVLEAAGADQALRVAAGAGPIDVLVTDVVMPGTDGRRLAQDLLAARPELKVLYISGYMEELLVKHGILQDETNFVQKPFTTLALAQKVRQLLDQP